MDTARYVIGVLLVVALPPGILLWFAIHPFAGFWRQLGATWTYVALSPLIACLMFLAFVNRELVLGQDLGTHLWLLAPTAFCLAAGIVVARKRRREFSNRLVAGIPELSRDKEKSRLITSGIYSRIRHPRYVELLLFVSAYAFFANHVGVYVTAALSFPALYLVVLIEERELRQRFGAEYEEYCRRVPRFLPARGSGRAA